MQQMPCAHFVCCLPRHVHHLLVDPCARFVGALAAKGDKEPAQSDGGAIRALADTIRNEEVDLIQRVQACVSSCSALQFAGKSARQLARQSARDLLCWCFGCSNSIINWARPLLSVQVSLLAACRRKTLLTSWRL